MNGNQQPLLNGLAGWRASAGRQQSSIGASFPCVSNTLEISHQSVLLLLLLLVAIPYPSSLISPLDGHHSTRQQVSSGGHVQHLPTT
jgi:hypothetical protein